MCLYRSATPERDCTAYTGRTPDGGVVWLWVFGVYYARPDHGGVFVWRFSFAPVLVDRLPPYPVYHPDHIPRQVRPTSQSDQRRATSLVRGLATWVSGYEHWAVETLGLAYREACLAGWIKMPVTPAREMTRSWAHLAKKSSRLTAADSRRNGHWGALLAGLRPPAFVPLRSLPVTHARPFLDDYLSADSLAERKLSLGEGDERDVVDLLVDQIEFADLIVVNKADLLSDARLGSLEAVLTSLNPGAKLVRTVRGRVPLSDLLNTHRFDFDRAAAAPGWMAVLRGEEQPETAEYGIGSFVYLARRPFHPADYTGS